MSEKVIVELPIEQIPITERPLRKIMAGARVRSGITLGDLAIKLNKSPSELSQIENECEGYQFTQDYLSSAHAHLRFTDDEYNALLKFVYN
jgi:hypothetical protein